MESTKQLTLTDFLSARFADDGERALFVWNQYSEHAKAHPWEQWRLSWQDEYDLLCIEPLRALAEVESKRRIVEAHRRADESSAYCAECDTHREWPCPTLRFLALPYSDHPDFDPEWRD